MGNSSGVPNDRTSTRTDFKERYASGLVTAMSHVDYPGEGICHGMCLDWIRLLLNGRVELFKAYHTEKGGSSGLILKEQEKMHNVFLKATESVTDELLLDNDNIIKGWRNAKNEKEKLHYKKASKELAAQASDDSQMYSLYYERFREEFRRNFVSFLTFDKIILDFGRTGQGGDPKKNLSDWFGAVRTYLKMLPKGTCALLQMFKRGGKGHFIAFYRHTAATHMFDPNLGWYCVGNEMVWEMFQDLWYALYREQGYDASNWRAFRKS